MIAAVLLLADTLWTDPYSGPWSAAPSRWYGDTAHIQRTEEGGVLRAPAAGKSFIWTDAPVQAPAEWSGKFALYFNPSSSNYLEFRAAEDGNGNGVGVRWGAIDDGVSMGRLSRNSLTTWIKSEPLILDFQKVEIEWKLHWSKNNYWLLSFKRDIDSAWLNLDSTYFVPTYPIRYTGWKAVYTSSNKNGFSWMNQSVCGRIVPDPLSDAPQDRPVASSNRNWRITEILASPASNRPEAPSVDFIEIQYVGSDTLRADGWSLGVNQYNYPLSKKIWVPNEVAVIGDSVGFPRALRKHVWQGKIQILSSYCWIQLRDNYGRPIVQSHIDPSWFIPADKSKGGFSWESNIPTFSCLNPIGWSVSESPTGSSPGVIDSDTSFTASPRQGGIKNWRWWDEHSILIEFRHPMFCINTGMAKIMLNAQPSDTAWALGPTRWVVQWRNGNFVDAEPGLLELNALKHCDDTEVDTLLIVGYPKPANPGDWSITEIMLNPEPGNYRYLELVNISDKWLDLGELRIAAMDPETATTVAYRTLADPGSAVAPQSCVAVSSFWGNPSGVFEQFDSTRLRISKETLPWNDDRARGRIENDRGDLLLQFDVQDSDHFPGLSDPEGHALTPVNGTVSEPAQWDWTSHAPGKGSPGLVQQKKPIGMPSGTWTVLNRRCVLGAPATIAYQNLKAPVRTETWVTTLTGQPIYRFSESLLLGENGLIIWNGMGYDGFPVPKGTYLLCVRGVDRRNQTFIKSWGIQVL